MSKQIKPWENQYNKVARWPLRRKPLSWKRFSDEYDLEIKWRDYDDKTTCYQYLDIADFSAAVDEVMENPSFIEREDMVIHHIRPGVWDAVLTLREALARS